MALNHARLPVPPLALVPARAYTLNLARPAPKALTVASNLDRVGAQEARLARSLPCACQCCRLRLAGSASCRRGGVVGGTQMVDQLLPVL